MSQILVQAQARKGVGVAVDRGLVQAQVLGNAGHRAVLIQQQQHRDFDVAHVIASLLLQRLQRLPLGRCQAPFHPISLALLPDSFRMALRDGYKCL